ncbi:MAG TPA: hypothetical protein VM756_03645 [Burkholderiales bacterium]|jgi:hypothetical protein|nr:hypothetical protein [Burkholderiales bacterium]
MVAVTGMAGCAVDNALTAARDSWRGATYEQVVAAWGPPAQSAKDSHTWRSEDRPPSSTERSGVGAGSVLFSAEGSGARCDRTLAFSGGRVRDATWSGDPEFCKRFALRPR